MTAFFLANGFLHASSPPPPLLTFSSYVPTLLSSPLFFPPFLLSPLLVFVLDRFRNPPPDTRRAQPSVQSQLCKRVFACVSWTEEGRKKRKKRKKKKKKAGHEARITNYECEKVLDRRNNRCYPLGTCGVVWPVAGC